MDILIIDSNIFTFILLKEVRDFLHQSLKQRHGGFANQHLPSDEIHLILGKFTILIR